MMGFTRRQVERDKLASKIYSNIGLPTGNKFNHTVSTNTISNCPISLEYINIAENMYGLLMASIKGNSTRRNPRPAIKDDIQITSKIYKNNSIIKLWTDIVYINGVVFLVSIDRKLKYRSIIQTI